MRVLVTRPQPGAARTVARLEALGHAGLAAPLLAIRPTGAPPPEGPFDALLVTSQQAVPRMGPLRGTGPVFAVGERTAAALGEAGFEDVRAGPGDAAGLARLVAETMPRGARLLHVTGRDRKPEPEAALLRLGFAPAAWEAYEAAAVGSLPEIARAGLAGHTIDTIMHFSRRTATLLLALTAREGLLPALRACRHLCLSDDVAAPLREAGLAPTVAARPDEEALLALLDTATPREPGST